MIDITYASRMGLSRFGCPSGITVYNVLDKLISRFCGIVSEQRRMDDAFY